MAKKEPTKAISIRLDGEKMADLANLARVEGTTVSEVVREAIRKWIDSRGTDPEFQKQVKKKLEEDIATFKRLAEKADE